MPDYSDISMASMRSVLKGMAPGLAADSVDMSITMKVGPDQASSMSCARQGGRLRPQVINQSEWLAACAQGCAVSQQIE